MNEQARLLARLGAVDAQPETLSSEHAHQVRLVKWVEDSLARWPALEMLFAVPNGGLRHPVVAAQLKAEGQRAGVPDLFLAAPRGGYPGLFIEMKKPRGVVSRVQKDWIARLRREGYRVEVCHGWTAARDLLIEYLKGSTQCSSTSVSSWSTLSA